MADSDDNQSQSDNQSNQQVSTPSQQPVEQPSIPATPDQSLASNMNKGLSVDNSIPVSPDQSLNSLKTMNEDGGKVVTSKDK